jgi:hypothetical protein
MVPMRTPDEDTTLDGDGSAPSSLGDGFGSSAGDLTDGFGDDDFSDDNYSSDSDSDDADFSDDSFDDTSDGDTSEGDSPGLSDAEAENVLVEILEDVFGDDGPEVLDGVEAEGFRMDGGEQFEAMDDAYASTDPVPDMTIDIGGELDGGGFDVPDDAFDPSDMVSEADFDLTGDGHVNVHDLHEAAHPFDFDISN